MRAHAWDTHYSREKARLAYPDENLVRLLKKNHPDTGINAEMTAIDLGCGSGRHLPLLHDLGFSLIIGMDASYNALRLSSEERGFFLVQNSNSNIPLGSEIADIVIAWGSLHYAAKDEFRVMLDEIRRILKRSGSLYATLRSNRDTYLKRGEHQGNDVWITNLDDLKGSVVSFYNENEMSDYFSAFGTFRFGISERSIIGDMKSVISHWIIHAMK